MVHHGRERGPLDWSPYALWKLWLKRNRRIFQDKDLPQARLLQKNFDSVTLSSFGERVGEAFQCRQRSFWVLGPGQLPFFFVWLPPECCAPYFVLKSVLLLFKFSVYSFPTIFLKCAIYLIFVPCSGRSIDSVTRHDPFKGYLRRRNSISEYDCLLPVPMHARSFECT